MKISELGELGFIHKIDSTFKQTLPQGVLGIGDDCSVIPCSEHNALLVTTDTLVEDVHFIVDKIQPQDLGYKSVMVNLSDIAAMGGKSHSIFLSLSIPQNTDTVWLDAFLSGVKSVCNKTDTLLLGGDTTASPAPLFINITAVGEVNKGNIKYRKDAQVGDIICVTDTLGDSAAGLRVMKEGIAPDKEAQYLIDKHCRPQAHLKEGLWLGKQSAVHAMMDISDGLNQDIGHILKASQKGAGIDINKLPISKQLHHVAKAQQWQEQALAICSGENYCLLLTVEKAPFDSISKAFEVQFGKSLYPIGSVTTKGKQRMYTPQETWESLSLKEYQHWV